MDLRVATTFEALLFEQMMQPIAGGNALASYGLMSIAQTVAERDGGFGAVLSSQLMHHGA